MILLRQNEKRDILKVSFLRKKRFDKLCIFSHFDMHQKIDAYVVVMIESIYKLGFDIVFVSTCHRLNSQELGKINKYLLMSVVKKNRGYDFISWKTGLSLVENYKEYRSILHTNDSIFFPLVNPQKMFDVMSEKELDFWGLTDSFKQTYHIESFFWIVNTKLIQSKIYEFFWNQCKILKDKSEIIAKYEIGFAPLFMKHSFSCGAYISLQKVLSQVDLFYCASALEDLSQRRSFHLFWDVIIEKFGAPFIKKRTLFENPTAFSYKEVLQKYTSYDVLLIEKVLERNEHEKQSEREKNNREFFANCGFLAQLLESLQKKKDLTLYGFGEVGYLIYSNLQKNTVKIVDKNALSLSTRYKHIDLFDSIEAITPSHTIFITALGREEVIKKNLYAMGVGSENIISIGSSLPFDPLVFANNITKLLYSLDALYRYAKEKNCELILCSANENFNQLLQNYLELHVLKNVTITFDAGAQNINFLLINKEENIHKKIDFYLK